MDPKTTISPDVDHHGSGLVRKLVGVPLIIGLTALFAFPLLPLAPFIVIIGITALVLLLRSPAEEPG